MLTLCSLLASGKHSGLKLLCADGNKVFKVHRAVLCGQSNCFEKACEPENFRVSAVPIFHNKRSSQHGIKIVQEGKGNIQVDTSSGLCLFLSVKNGEETIRYSMMLKLFLTMVDLPLLKFSRTIKSEPLL